MIADIAIHNPKGKNQNHKSENENPHAHIMLTMRPFNEDGTWGDKQRKVYILDDNGEKIYDPKKRQYKCGKVQTTDWNERNKAEEWRASWADICNEYFEKANRPERIDHRSFARQGITDKLPTIHLGVAAHQMEQRGILTERGNINRQIEISNRKLRLIEEQIHELQGWLEEENALMASEEITRAKPISMPQSMPQVQSRPEQQAKPQTTMQQSKKSQPQKLHPLSTPAQSEKLQQPISLP